MNLDNSIIIGKPTVSTENGWTRMTSVVRDRGVERNVWFEVEERYGEYLCYERADAFLIGVLNYAMREHCDIRCEAPVGSELLYQIRTYLIPSLTRFSKMLYDVQIDAAIDSTIMRNAGGVGAGLSCGVDSMHVVANYATTDYPGLKLTHLVLNNVGAFYKGKEDRQYEWQTQHARAFCKEYGYEFIQTNSNIADEIVQNHFYTHTYSSCFAVYALQKLWNVYFYGSSGEDFSAFSLLDNEAHDAAHYELLSLDVFSTRSLKIYSEGGAIDRFDKMKRLVTFAPTYKYLHVCGSDSGPNCGHCGKCLRTLTALDALGAIGKYREAFDVEGYLKDRKENLRWLYRQQVDVNGDKMTAPAYRILRREIGVFDKLIVHMRMTRDSCFVVRVKLRLIHLFPRLYKLYRKYVRHYAD